jgi:glutamine amidotransferase
VTGRPRGYLAVLDYGIGNLRSAQKALEHLGADARLTADEAEIAGAAAVVLPGVGAFGACMDALRAAGLEEVARSTALDGRPFLGICVGMQMLFEASDESPGTPGLAVLRGRVERLPATVKLPQMGWNTFEIASGSRLLGGLPDPAWCYFVHSYAVLAHPAAAAWCEYGTRFVAAVEQGPLWATQFHPEKSGRVGMAVLENFVDASAVVPARA